MNRDAVDPGIAREREIAAAVAAPRPEPLALAMAARFSVLSAVERLRLLTAAPTVQDLCALTHGEVELATRRALRRTPWRPRELRAQAETDRRWLRRREHHLFWIGDPSYPHRLRRLFDPPPVLYVHGNPAVLNPPQPPVAIVGTRRPDGDGRAAAFALGMAAAAAGVSVVSGLALGIDAAAHRGVVVGGDASQAVVVLGSGIDGIYPAGNRDFAAAILDDGGAVVSEYAPGVPPGRHRFPARNRIIAAMSDLVVIVEAPHGSGALHTHAFAHQVGVPVAVHRSGLSYGGTAALAEDGAPVVEEWDDVVRLMGEHGIAPADAAWAIGRAGAGTGDKPSDRGDDRDVAGRLLDRAERRKLARFGAVAPPVSMDRWRESLQTADTLRERREAPHE